MSCQHVPLQVPMLYRQYVFFEVETFLCLTPPFIFGITATSSCIVSVSSDNKVYLFYTLLEIDLNFSDSMSNVIFFELIKIGDTGLNYEHFLLGNTLMGQAKLICEYI